MEKLIEIYLELNEQGYVKTDGKLQTNVKELYAVGDVLGSSPIGALTAAYDGGMAATSIVHECTINCYISIYI